MATVNFSVPDEVRDAFDETFKGRNMSAIIADLMREAVERFQRQERSHEAIERILERRRDRRSLSDNDIRSARRTSMIAVLDASVVFKWFLGDSRSEPHAAAAVAALRGVDTGAVRMVQPPHFLAETVAVLARVQPATVDEDLLLLRSIAWEVAEWPSIYSTAVELSIRLRHHLLDTLYHATAMHHDDAVLVTSDEAYYEKSHAEGRIVRLRDFEPP